MQKLLNTIENTKGKRLVFLLLSTFVVFILVGVAIGYFMDNRLKQNEMVNTPVTNNSNTNPQEVSYEGIVQYVSLDRYPGEGINYSLVKDNGEVIVLLRSQDDKLTIVEGLKVLVVGRMMKTKDGKTDVMQVSSVVLQKNGTN